MCSRCCTAVAELRARKTYILAPSALRHCTQKSGATAPQGDGASQKASRLESTNMLSHEDDEAHHQMNPHRDLQGCSQCWPFTQRPLVLPTNTRQWNPSGCHSTENIIQTMPSRGGCHKAVEQNPNQTPMGFSDLCYTGCNKRAEEAEQRPRSLLLFNFKLY